MRVVFASSETRTGTNPEEHHSVLETCWKDGMLRKIRKTDCLTGVHFYLKRFLRIYDSKIVIFTWHSTDSDQVPRFTVSYLHKVQKIECHAHFSALHAKQLDAASIVLNNSCLNSLQVYYELCSVCKTAPCDIRYFNYIRLHSFKMYYEFGTARRSLHR